MKKVALSQKTRDICWLLFLLKVQELSFEELKVVFLLNGLSNGTCCVRLDKTAHLQMAGLNTEVLQKRTLKMLFDKNIIIPKKWLEYNTATYVSGRICPRCPLGVGSKAKECHSRKGDVFINKDYTQWVLSKKPKYQDELLFDLLELNGVVFDSPYKLSLTQKINYEIESLKEKRKNDLHCDDAMDLFMASSLDGNDSSKI